MAEEDTKRPELRKPPRKNIARVFGDEKGCLAHDAKLEHEQMQELRKHAMDAVKRYLDRNLPFTKQDPKCAARAVRYVIKQCRNIMIEDYEDNWPVTAYLRHYLKWTRRHSKSPKGTLCKRYSTPRTRTPMRFGRPSKGRINPSGSAPSKGASKPSPSKRTFVGATPPRYIKIVQLKPDEHDRTGPSQPSQSRRYIDPPHNQQAPVPTKDTPAPSRSLAAPWPHIDHPSLALIAFIGSLAIPLPSLLDFFNREGITDLGILRHLAAWDGRDAYLEAKNRDGSLSELQRRILAQGLDRLACEY